MTQRITHQFLFAALLGVCLSVSHAADKKEAADPVVKNQMQGFVTTKPARLLATPKSSRPLHQWTNA